MDKTKQEYMYELVDRWRSSGQTQKEFCGDQEIKVSTFAYWVSKKTQLDEPSGGFLPIQTGQLGGAHLTITYPNGVVITVGTPDMGVITQLIHLS